MSEASRASGHGPNQRRVGSTVNGKWHIDARIGSGGMATVYAATHRNGRRVAIKMLHSQLSRDEGTRARFLREGYVANAVGHPAVVHVEDDGISEDGAAFLVLDLLEGDTLEARRTQSSGRLPIDEVLHIADQALDALAAAHEKGIVHRDVKPDNVFLCLDGKVKLLDFGLARMKDSQGEATRTGVTIGTPAFMSPEQAQGLRDEVDARSDVWGLGATLFTLLSGEYVHDASTLHEQLIASATLRPRRISELVPYIAPSIAIVIDRALELDKNDRWESAREMQRALRAASAQHNDESDRLLADSLTMPAVAPPSLRRGAGSDAPRSGPRPSGPAASALPISSGRTLELKPPSSDATIQDEAPVTVFTAREGIPSSGSPVSPPPNTQRLTGARGSGSFQQPTAEEILLAQTGPHQHLSPQEMKQTRKMHAPPAQAPPEGAQGPGHPQHAYLQQPQHHQQQQQHAHQHAPQGQQGQGQQGQAQQGQQHQPHHGYPHTFASPAGAMPAGAPLSPTLASAAGSGPYGAVSNGNGPPRSERPIPPRGSGSLLHPGPPLAMPHPHPAGPRPGAGPSSAPTSMLGPQSLRQRRSARWVVAISFLLIVMCAAAATWLLQR